jgi:hypothetical protein
VRQMPVRIWRQVRQPRMIYAILLDHHEFGDRRGDETRRCAETGRR